MTLTVTDRIIRSAGTCHTARPDHPGAAAWRVSWLPDRVLTRGEAVAAMQIAEAVGQMPADCDPEVYDDTFWDRGDAMAAVLGMAGATAVVLASEPPRPAAPDGTDVPSCPACQAGPPHIGWLGAAGPRDPDRWHCAACDHEWETPDPFPHAP